MDGPKELSTIAIDMGSAMCRARLESAK